MIYAFLFICLVATGVSSSTCPSDKPVGCSNFKPEPDTNITCYPPGTTCCPMYSAPTHCPPKSHCCPGTFQEGLCCPDNTNCVFNSSSNNAVSCEPIRGRCEGHYDKKSCLRSAECGWCGKDDGAPPTSFCYDTTKNNATCCRPHDRNTSCEYGYYGCCPAAVVCNGEQELCKTYSYDSGMGSLCPAATCCPKDRPVVCDGTCYPEGTQCCGSGQTCNATQTCCGYGIENVCCNIGDGTKAHVGSPNSPAVLATEGVNSFGLLRSLILRRHGMPQCCQAPDGMAYWCCPGDKECNIAGGGCCEKGALCENVCMPSPSHVCCTNYLPMFCNATQTCCYGTAGFNCCSPKEYCMADGTCRRHK